MCIEHKENGHEVTDKRNDKPTKAKFEMTIVTRENKNDIKDKPSQVSYFEKPDDYHDSAVILKQRPVFGFTPQNVRQCICDY